jgi:hypothetical protein
MHHSPWGSSLVVVDEGVGTTVCSINFPFERWNAYMANPRRNAEVRKRRIIVAPHSPRIADRDHDEKVSTYELDVNRDSNGLEMRH